jgi:hypothetical protein
MKTTAVIFAIFVILLSCGVIWAAHACWFGLWLNPEIKPVEVLTLAVSILIAILLQYYFVAKATDLRAEKDLLIENTREALTLLRSCRDTLNSCHDSGKISAADEKQIKTVFRRLSNSLEHLETAIGMSQCLGMAKEFGQIKQAYLSFKIAATGGFFPSKPYTPSTISSQEQASRLLASNLQQLIFKINKHN